MLGIKETKSNTNYNLLIRIKNRSIDESGHRCFLFCKKLLKNNQIRVLFHVHFFINVIKLI